MCQSNCHSPARKTKKKLPQATIFQNILRSTIWLFGSLGFSFITRESGGRVDNAMAAKVSIIKFTHNIWVTVNGESKPKYAESTDAYDIHKSIQALIKMFELAYNEKNGTVTAN